MPSAPGNSVLIPCLWVMPWMSYLATRRYWPYFYQYGYSTFLPTIINGLGKWSIAQVQALTIPCYCLGALSYLVVARISVIQQRRGFCSVIFGAVSVLGYGLLISDSSNGVHYFGCFLVACGLYIVAVGKFSRLFLPSFLILQERFLQREGTLS